MRLLRRHATQHADNPNKFRSKSKGWHKNLGRSSPVNIAQHSRWNHKDEHCERSNLPRRSGAFYWHEKISQMIKQSIIGKILTTKRSAISFAAKKVCNSREWLPTEVEKLRDIKSGLNYSTSNALNFWRLLREKTKSCSTSHCQEYFKMLSLNWNLPKKDLLIFYVWPRFIQRKQKFRGWFIEKTERKQNKFRSRRIRRSKNISI